MNFIQFKLLKQSFPLLKPPADYTKRFKSLTTLGLLSDAGQSLKCAKTTFVVKWSGFEHSVWNHCVGKSQVRVGPPGEVYVCGGGLGFEGQYRSGSRAMWKRDITYSGFQPARILIHVSHADTQILKCLAETACSRKSKLMMFDTGRLRELLSDTSGILLSPSGRFLYIWSWLSTSLPCTQSGIKPSHV